MHNARGFAIPWLLCVTAAAGCVTDPVTGKSVLGIPMSAGEESELGLGARPGVTQTYGGAYPDEQLRTYLGGIVTRIAQTSARPDLPWSFTILNSSQLNAFALPGGQVFVTRGLLAKLEDEAEFVVVMGHEIGHVEHRHSAQQAGRQALVGLAGSVAASQAGDKYVSAIQAGQGLVLSKYSRDQERESDVRGVRQALALGYDPREGADVFRTFLREKQKAGGEAAVPWLSSHPADDERIDEVLRLSAELDPRLRGSERNPGREAEGAHRENERVPGLVVTTDLFAQQVRRLREEQRVYDRYDEALARAAKGGEPALRAALPEIETAARGLPEHALPSSTAGLIRLALGDEEGAEPWLQRAAGLRQELSEPHWLLGELAVRRKQWNDAVSHANRALQIFPQDYRALSVRAMAFGSSGRTAEAQRDYQAVVQLAPENSPEHRAAQKAIGTPAPTPPRPRQPRR